MTPEEAGAFLIQQFYRLMRVTDQTDEDNNLHWQTQEKVVEAIMLITNSVRRLHQLEETIDRMEEDILELKLNEPK